MASVLDGLEFKPHLGGHGDEAHYSRGVLHGARALTSNRVLPHCDLEGLSTLGLKQWSAEIHRPAPVFDGLEVKPHPGGHGDKAHYSRGVLHGARALTSNRMLPHCGFEGLCTLGLRR